VRFSYGETRKLLVTTLRAIWQKNHGRSTALSAPSQVSTSPASAGFLFSVGRGAKRPTMKLQHNEEEDDWSRAD
jgi:hypothetical protein